MPQTIRVKTKKKKRKEKDTVVSQSTANEQIQDYNFGDEHKNIRRCSFCKSYLHRMSSSDWMLYHTYL